MKLQDLRKILALIALGAATAGAQEVKRDVKVTGPRGRSVERQIDTIRTPGHVERDIKITRPSGTYERDTVINRGGGGGGGGFVRGPGPRGDVYVERDYIVGPPPPSVVFGGGPSFGFFLGGPVLPPPPPPIFFAPAPVFVPPPVVVVQPPVRYAPLQPQTIVADPVAAAMERLQSSHDHSRRDGALTLGRLGDARAVPPLIERVDKDWAKEVRVAACWALGEIGDPRAAITLQKASLYDKRKEVRDAANIGYKKLGRETINNANVQVAPSTTSTSTPSAIPEPPPSNLGEPPLESPRSLDPPPPPRPVRPSDLPR